MRAVRFLVLRWALIASGIVLGLALAAGAVRILPWLLAPSVPLRVTFPFARALAGVAIETAFVVGAPIGIAFAAAVLVRRGDARALFALGVSPAAIARAALPVLVCLGVVAIVVQRVADPQPNAPGRFAGALIAQGRASCAAAGGARSVVVPMLGASWLCFPDGSARIAGRVPGGLRSAWFTARDLRPSDTLTEFTLWDARIAFPRTRSLPETHVAVKRAVVRGLPAWGQAARLDANVRGGVIAVSIWIAALAVMWSVLRGGIDSLLGSLLVGGSGALVMLSVLHSLDRSGSSLGAYVCVSLSGVATAGLIAACLPRIASFVLRVMPSWRADRR